MVVPYDNKSLERVHGKNKHSQELTFITLNGI
jgi:hypothetical protein